MALRWNIWHYIIRKAAKRHGFFDPVDFLAKMRQLSQPSEVQEPIELIRAGALFHARGLLNTKVIQNNLDWIWPFWVNRQFNPNDKSFLPRAFSFSHVNLTHRNWTAIAAPGFKSWPIVDPRGMVTPEYDGWSIDHGLRDADGTFHYFSEFDEAKQYTEWDNDHFVIYTLFTTPAGSGAELSSWVKVSEKGIPILTTSLKQTSGKPVDFIISIRPANPEGVQFIQSIQCEKDACSINQGNKLRFLTSPSQQFTSNYAHGDVLHRLSNNEDQEDSIQCNTGLATAAFQFNANGESRSITYEMPLSTTKTGTKVGQSIAANMEKTAQMKIPHLQFSRLFDNAKNTMRMLSDGEIVPGPYTYRRFWFRDACLMGNALLGLNSNEVLEENLAQFPARQKHDGYFHSQEGEWDSNGQVLWLVNRFERSVNRTCPHFSDTSLIKAARWIIKKRQKSHKADPRHAGLLPPGFSAEHLGPNDYYFWDDLWAISGLDAARELFLRRQKPDLAREFETEAKAFRQDLRKVIDQIPENRCHGAIPASPYRRMDSGAIGTMVADYPLNIESICKERIINTAHWLHTNCLQHGAFFQDMIHSGMNAYLTLALAQTFLKHDDSRWLNLVQSVADLASPTGNWPEAIHPHTKGGCMGDGQHGWAASEWCLMMRSLFVLEDDQQLYLGKGLLPDWFEGNESLEFGPTPTPWGPLTIQLFRDNNQWYFQGDAQWHHEPPEATIAIPGFSKQPWDGSEEPVVIQ